MSNNFILFLLTINIIITTYLFIKNRNQEGKIKKISELLNLLNSKNNNTKNTYPINDKEMIGLFYPDIEYDKIKEKLKNQNNIIDTMIEFINQLEIKLIYLEKEINLTKIISFYTSRKYYLSEHKVEYDEKNITQLHEIVNWIIIHQSNQLKGIASDKYLSCKYVQFKLGLNLCKQRIRYYNNIKDLNYKELSQYGNIVLKISNSCWKLVFINKNETEESFKEKIEIFKKLYESEHGIVNIQPFHLYAKKRIIIEKQFIPFTELYEFKIYVLNRNIKFCYLSYHLNETQFGSLIYDSDFNFIKRKYIKNEKPFNLKSLIDKSVLEKLKIYAIKLSEDFPDFIRVDLYVFHNNIYLSELTFASFDGIPWDKNETYNEEAVKNFSRLFNNY